MIHLWVFFFVAAVLTSAIVALWFSVIRCAEKLEEAENKLKDVRGALWIIANGHPFPRILAEQALKIARRTGD